MDAQNHGIPNGLAHLELVARGASWARTETEKHLDEHKAELELFGICLTALYQAATCHRKCFGNAHILEALCGRAYNISIAAYNLILLGLYDEALNLTRGIGEISNLVWLSITDSDAIKEWIALDDKGRRRKFSPAKVRDILKKGDVAHAYADDDWYSDLCEKYVHVTPKTQPNKHDETSGFVGGRYQKDGMKKSLESLVGVVGVISLLVCRYFEFDDLFSEIKGAASSEDEA